MQLANIFKLALRILLLGLTTVTSAPIDETSEYLSNPALAIRDTPNDTANASVTVPNVSNATDSSMNIIDPSFNTTDHSFRAGYKIYCFNFDTSEGFYQCKNGPFRAVRNDFFSINTYLSVG